MKALIKFLAPALACALMALPSAVQAEKSLYESASLTPEAALKAAQAAFKACSDKGYLITVSVADRSGLPLVMLRDRYAGWHTVDVSMGKARTAVSFRTPTGALAERTQAGRPESGIRQIPGVVMIGGGLSIEAAGSLVGGIGVSGAPGGDLDEACAQAGIAAIEEDLVF